MRGHGPGTRGESGAIYIVTDSSTISEKYIADALASRGRKAEIINISEMPIHAIYGLVIIRIQNPYTAVAYASLVEKSINSAQSIYAALNRLTWIPKFGPPYAVVSADVAVEKVELEKPWMLLTAWRLGLDGAVTSVEGAKSVLEHRLYMRNPLAKASVLIPRPRRTVTIYATEKNAEGLAAEVLRFLGLKYARVTLGDYGGRFYVVDVDPVPPIENRQEAELLAEAI
ncbi:MAG: hypothetical protein ABWK05_03880 [Pyrobaculum sp.]